jgi:hypothetical protein
MTQRIASPRQFDPRALAPTCYTKALTVVNATIRSANPKRVKMVIQNKDTAALECEIRVDGGGANALVSIRIAAGGAYEFGPDLAGGAFSGNAPSGNLDVSIAETVLPY